MNKHRNPKKISVARPPSRIRRDPVPVEKPASLEKALWQSREREIAFALAGMTVFALAISAAVIDIGHLLSR